MDAYKLTSRQSRYKYPLKFISIDMGFLNFLKYNVEDIFCCIKRKKWKFIFCAVICVVGVVIGVALFCATSYGWWYYNRCDFASKLIGGGFYVFLSFFVSFALTYFLLLFCAMFRQSQWLSYVVCFVSSLYCGANSAALFTYSTLWGIFYIILVAAAHIVITVFCCFICNAEPPVRREFREVLSESKQLILILSVGLIYKLLAFFVILKILTAYI